MNVYIEHCSRTNFTVVYYYESNEPAAMFNCYEEAATWCDRMKWCIVDKKV